MAMWYITSFQPAADAFVMSSVQFSQSYNLQFKIKNIYFNLNLILFIQNVIQTEQNSKRKSCKKYMIKKYEN